MNPAFCFLTGLEICLGKPLDDNLLHFIHNEVRTLFESFDDYREEEDEKNKKILDTLELFKSDFGSAIKSLQEKQSSLETTCEGMKEEMKRKDKEQNGILKRQEQVEKKQREMDKRQEQGEKRQKQVEKRQEEVETACKALEEKTSVMQKDLDVLRTTRDDISPSVDSTPIVFDSPHQNRWFTGREKEIKILEKCLAFESDMELKIAAICGLGGCGKTTLAAQFAWKRKPDYKGGVFWISMEDDEKFRNSMNDVALRMGLMEDSKTFDLTLSKVLTYISQQKKPCLMVTDNVDQLTLSEEMHKVLSGRWKRQATCHLLLTTRREPKEVCERVDLEPSCCVELCSFSQDEAKSFLVTRIGVDNAIEQEEILSELAGELGCLPLALEQAGAHIKALQCPITEYLNECKSQRLKLLSQHPTNPSWEYECRSRLSVHTTWLINLEYIKKSTHGELASRFLQAAAFLLPDEIPEDIIDCELLLAECSQRQSIELPLLADHIVELLTKFSLLQRKNNRCLGMHRLVQDFIRENKTTEETKASIRLSVKMFKQYFTRFCSQTANDVTTLDQKKLDLNVSALIDEHRKNQRFRELLPYSEFVDLVKIRRQILEGRLKLLEIQSTLS